MYEGLIFDVGMHKGKDAEFYLKKGFDVIGIEANSQLVEEVRSRLGKYVANGRLTICDIAVTDYDGEIDFYVNDAHNDWGTISKRFAARNERLGTTNIVTKIKCTSFHNILTRYGIPFYLKIDIEGADTLCLKALYHFPDRPKYISIEAGLTSMEEAFTELSLLWNLGYSNFKIVNQAMNKKVRCQNPSLEGLYVDYQFDGTSSGPFGEEAPGKWQSIDQTLTRYRWLLTEQKYFGAEGRFYKTPIHKTYEILKGERVGWYDIHAKLQDR